VSNALSVVNLERVDHSGFLYKQGEINKEWKLRWFALITNALFYFDDKQEIGRKEVPSKGAIFLEDGTFRKYGTGIGNSFEIVTYHRTYILRAEDETAFSTWKAALLKAGLKEGTVTQETEAEILVTKKEVPSKSISLSSSVDKETHEQTLAKKTEETKPDNNFQLSDISAEVEKDLAPPSHKQTARITTKEISSSEAQYFSKFGLLPPNPNPYDKPNQFNNVSLNAEDSDTVDQEGLITGKSKKNSYEKKC